MSTDPKADAKHGGSTSAEVADWGDAWLQEWIQAGPLNDRDSREWQAGHWRAATLGGITEEWRRGRADPGYLESKESWDRYTVSREVGDLVRLYGMTLNGLVVWRIYREYRDAGMPVPEMVLVMFDKWAKALESTSGAAEIARAIQMSEGTAGAQGAAQLRKTERRRAVASDVHFELRHGKVKPAEAYRRVARRHDGMTAGAVKKLWMDWNRAKRSARAASSDADLEGAMRRLVGGKVREPDR